MLLAGCNGPKGPAGARAPEPPPYEELARAQNDRVDRIHRAYGRGVIELTWTDEEGRHFEQGELDLWIELPDRSALNIEKFGQRLFWLGSNASNTWMFDFRGDESVLYVADVGQAPGTLPLEPSIMAALCGLAELPPDMRAPVRYDAGQDAWIVAAESRGRAVLLYLDRKALLPVRAEILNDTGQVALFSRLKLARYERITAAGSPAGSGPLFPTLADLQSADDRLAVKLSVPSPSDDVLEDRFFNLDRLIEAFKPARVEGLTGSPMAAGGDGS